jgi:hypothetical protein
MLEEFPAICSWKLCDEVVNLFYDRYIEWRLQETLEVFKEMERKDAELGRWLQAALKALPVGAVSRFVTSPEIYSRTCGKNIGDGAFFRSALIAEQILGGDYSLGQQGWSALGDFYFGSRRLVDPCRESWDSQSSLAAPRVGSLIPLDFVSPNAREVEPVQWHFEPYTPEEVSKLRTALEDALAKVETASRNAAFLIKRFLRVLILRKDRSSFQGSTSSMRSHIGRVLIRNGEQMEVGTLAEALVRETIHAFSSTITLSEPWLTKSSAVSIVIRSPWSGRSLPLHTYIETCFVWFGLVKFWRAALFAEAFSSEVTKTNLAKALSGFRGPNPTSKLMPYRHIIRSGVLDVADSLWGILQGDGDLAGE